MTVDPDQRGAAASHSVDWLRPRHPFRPVVRQRPAARAWSIALILALVFFTGVLLRPLLPIDETRYLSVAWEMHLTGDYLVPHMNGETYAHKPPLLFWLINLVWWVTGVSEFAARCVGPAFALLNLYLTHRLALTLFRDHDVAQDAVLVLASLFVYGLFSGLTMFDAMLTTASLLFLIGLWQAAVEERFAYWTLSGAALGLGVLAKGPVILVHTAPLLVLLPVWRPQGASGARVLRGLGTMVLIAFGIVAAWLVPAILAGGDAYRHELIWTQTAGRVANAFAHERPVWFFLALVPVYLFPWSLHFGLWRALRTVDLYTPQVRFLAIHIAAAFVAFSLIASKQAHYLLPELPAAGLLIAFALSGKPRRATDGLVFVLPLIAVLVIAILVATRAVSDTPLPPWLPADIGVCLGLMSVIAIVSLTAALGKSLFAASLWTAVLLAAINVSIAFMPLRSEFTIEDFADFLRDRKGIDIAWFGRPYHAEFNFLARFETPVFLPMDRDDLARWAASHPEGLIIVPLAKLETSAEPIFHRRVSGSELGIWTASSLQTVM